jgi:hypothetical protein
MGRSYGEADKARWRRNAARRYAEKGDEIRPRNRVTTKKRVAEHRAKVQQYKAERGCADCGWGPSDPRFHPSALDLDHRPNENKLYTIAAMMSLGWNTIATEIAKCDVVCARCHRLRTIERHLDGTQELPGRARLEDQVPPRPTLFDGVTYAG